MASTPRMLVNTSAPPAEPRRGAIWSIDDPERDLDSNLVRLPADEEIASHLGAEVDVLVHVVSGHGTLSTDDGETPLRVGALVFLPRRSRRGFRARSEERRVGDGPGTWCGAALRRWQRSVSEYQ